MSFMYNKPPGLQGPDDEQGLHAGDAAGHPQPRRHRGMDQVCTLDRYVPSCTPTMQGDGAINTVLRGIAAVSAPENFSLKRASGARSPIRGGLSADADNQQFVLPDEQLEAVFEAQQAAAQSKAQRKLMRRLQREQEEQQVCGKTA